MLLKFLQLPMLIINKFTTTNNHLLPPLPACGIDFLILLCCYSCSDFGFLTVSSMDRIVQAASVAALRAFTFTINGSHTKDLKLSPIPLLMSTPMYMFSGSPLAELNKIYRVYDEVC